jgi:predicted regulator of Ras-like GTPase activity (Roadblock/LC7/MglB family)
MAFQESLSEVCERVPGARAAWVMSLDGISVAQHIVGPAGGSGDGLDLEALLVEIGPPLKQLVRGVEQSRAGGLRCLELDTEHGAVLVRLLSEEYFLALVLEPGGLVGRGRFELRAHAPGLSRELL